MCLVRGRGRLTGSRGENSAKLRWLGLVISVGMYPFCFRNGVPRRKEVSGG